MSDTGAKLSFKEKLGYGMGDTAANFVFQTMVILQLAFYTDTFGITAAAAGTLFLVVRVIDAVFDPMMGVIADRTNTRWGKFRPWVIWTAVPFGIMGFLTFYTPELNSDGKLIYAYSTYILLMIVYSANNLPYSALSGVMTGDPGERTSLSSFRFVCAMVAQLVIQGLALPMVKYFGQGNSARGYQVTMGIFGVLSVLFFIVTFSVTKERIRPAPEQQATVGQHFSDLVKNRPWLVMFAVTVLLFITLSMRGGVLLYYFKYFVGDENLFSTFNVAGTISTIVGVLLSKPLAMRFGKRDVFITGLLGTAALNIAFVFFPKTAIALMFGTEIARQFVYGLTIPLLWAMMADVADFSEWRNGRRATGIVFSAIVFGLKAGLGFGGAIAGYLLTMYGYVPNAAQTERALDGIRWTMSVYVGISFALCGLALLFYEINKATELKMAEDLAERRKKYGQDPELQGA